MPCYRVEFYQRRTIVTHLQAESEDDIHDFLADNPNWNILEDAPEAIDEDDTEEFDDDELHDAGDYAVVPGDGVDPLYGIHEGCFVEVES